jgi:glycine cleavage system protein P-like pyridoxal-binding family
MNGFEEGVDGVLLSFDGYGRVVSHLVPKLLGNGPGVAAMMSSGAYSQSIASLSSNIYSSVSSVLRGTSLALPMGGDGLNAAAGASVLNTALLEAVGRVRRVVGTGTRARKDMVIL